MSGLFYPTVKQAPMIGLTGMGGGVGGFSFLSGAKNNDAGKYTSDSGSLCSHFYQLGVNTDASGYGGTDVGSAAGGASARDLTINDTGNAGTPMSSVGSMPPGIAYARHLSTSAEANNFWTTTSKAYGLSGNYWFFQYFCYPTGSIGNQSSGTWQPFKQGYTGRSYAMEFWVDRGSNPGFDYCKADYNARWKNFTWTETNMPTIDKWNFIRFGRDAATFKYQVYSWDGSSWTQDYDLGESGCNSAPEGISTDEYAQFWAVPSNAGQTGYVANFAQGWNNIWGEGVPTGVVP